MTLSLAERHALLAGRLSYRELLRLDPRIFADEALATEGARTRLRRWAEAGCPTPDRSALVYVGDGSLEPIVRRVVDSIPDAVAWHVVRSTVVAGIGRDALGWIVLPPQFPEPVDEALRLVTITGDHHDDTVAGIVAHELSHGWTCGVVEPASRPTLAARREEDEERRRVSRLAVDWGERTTGVLVRRREQTEREADALARLWGFHPPCGPHRHDYFRRQVEREAATAAAETESPP